MEWFACVVNNVITWSTCDQVKAKFCLVVSVGRFTCKERVMFFEREIRLLFCVNKWCFLTYKHVTRQSSMASHETFMRLS